MTDVQQSILQLDKTQKALRESLVTAWALLHNSESSLANLKAAIRDSLVGEQPEVKAEETETEMAGQTVAQT